jgi:hypothetical protein
MKRLEIFKPGTFVASDGREYTFTESDLRACAAAYDAAKHEAPLCVGHPKDDAPAYGWVERAAFADGALQIDTHQVDAAFAELVATGRFKKRSAAFYPPDSAQNPVSGAWYLRHVGFLGAQPPAVKGLRDAAFADKGEGLVEFTDWNGMTVAGLFRKIKNWIIDQSGQEKADAVLPEYDIENLQTSAAQKDPVPATVYSEGDDVDKQELERREAQLKAEQDKLARERAEFAERDKALKASETAAQIAQRRRGAAEFVELQVKDGRVLPAHRDGLVAFMAALPEAGVIEFGEGDKAVTKPSAEWLREYLKAQPKIVDFKERAGAAQIDTGDADAIARAALEYQDSERKAGRIVAIDVAVDHIVKGAVQ